MKPVIIIFVGVFALVLASCGQYGPLYLPHADQGKTQNQVKTV